MLHYEKYGAEFIKKHAKASPDAYIQMCMQLAFYRQHGVNTPVYETASVRQYLHGRTETCRSLSVESRALTMAFDAKTTTPAQKRDLFRSACEKHVAYLKRASNAHGVDRHLLGLKLVMQPNESTPVFTHPLFAQSQKWRLSTSGLFYSDKVSATGFGAAYPDGYGINYTIGPSRVQFGIESKTNFSRKTGGSQGFAKALAKVLDDVRVLFEVQVDSKL